MALRAFKYRLYPTSEQAVLFAKRFGCVRWVYNWGLAKKTATYQTENKSLSCFDLQAELPALKKAIADVSWSKFTEQVKYKCEWYGKNFI